MIVYLVVLKLLTLIDAEYTDITCTISWGMLELMMTFLFALLECWVLLRVVDAPLSMREYLVVRLGRGRTALLVLRKFVVRAFLMFVALYFFGCRVQGMMMFRHVALLCTGGLILIAIYRDVGTALPILFITDVLFRFFL